MQKKSFKFITYINSISFIIFVLLFVVHFFSFNEPFYAKQHRKLKLNNQYLADYIGITNEELDDLTNFTLHYLNDKNATLDKQMIIKGKLREVFTDDEKLHMVDVQKLSINSRYICIASLIIYLCSLFMIIKNKKISELYKANKNVYKFLITFLAILITWILIDFDSFWNFFHHIFFAGNDLWILDLSKDILIMIVPPDFFFNLVTTIVIAIVVVLFVYYFALYYLNKRLSYD